MANLLDPTFGLTEYINRLNASAKKAEKISPLGMTLYAHTEERAKPIGFTRKLRAAKGMEAPVSDDKIQEAVTLITDFKFTTEQAAKKIGVTVTHLRYRLFLARKALKTSNDKPPINHALKTLPKVPRVKELLAQNLSLRQIQKLTGVSVNTIRTIKKTTNGSNE